MADPVATNTAPDPSSWSMQVNPPVFFISAALILAFVLFGALFPEQAGQVFAAAQAVITIDFGWFYVVAVAGFLFFVLFLMLSRYGDVKLGPRSEEQTSELQSLMRTSYAVFCLKKKIKDTIKHD